MFCLYGATMEKTQTRDKASTIVSSSWPELYVAVYKVIAVKTCQVQRTLVVHMTYNPMALKSLTDALLFFVVVKYVSHKLFY